MVFGRLLYGREFIGLDVEGVLYNCVKSMNAVSK